MAFRRKQFTFYESYFHTIEGLKTNKEKLQAYRMLCNYALYGDQPPLESVSVSAATFFRAVQPVLDTARSRAEAGQKGGLA